MMRDARMLALAAAAMLLGGCAGTPPTHHVTLEDGRPRMARASSSPSVAVLRVQVPERIDRPQLVWRTAGNEVTLSERYRWAEPLRQEIPRVIANDLGELLDSNQVVAQPIGGFDADLRLTLDFQQLAAVASQGVDVDVLWRLERRRGTAIVGRSSFRQPLAEGATADSLALVAAQRQALRRVARGIAEKITANFNHDDMLHSPSPP